MSNEAERLCNEGLELMSQHRWVEAEEKMAQAVMEDDQSPQLWYNLGKCCFHRDRFKGAITALEKAVKLNKFYHEAHALLGSCYYAIHDPWEAKMCFSRASGTNNEELRRECYTARAHCYLATGEYTVGFEEYEYRLAEANTWTGTQSLIGKTLLIKAEGGLGDQIFFARYVHLLITLGAGYVIWELDEPLLPYIGDWGVEVIKRGDIVEHDYMVHAGSLPHIFGTKAGTIPVFGANPRLFPENPYRIGIACSGNPLHPDDHHRSIPLAEFAPLFELDKDFLIAQKDLRQSDEQVFMNTPNLRTLSVVEDMFDMSRLVASRDLVITVDTMTAHLAGAEGIPTWLLLPYAPDWRWKLEGDRTPWYPSMRIFRQGEDREWGPVIQRVVEELRNA